MPYTPPIPEPNRPPKQRSALASLAEAEKMIQVSILLPASAFVGWLMGAWLDKTLHQTWISLVGILFGGISGIVYVVRMVVTQGARSGGSTQSGPAAQGADKSGSPVKRSGDRP